MTPLYDLLPPPRKLCDCNIGLSRSSKIRIPARSPVSGADRSIAPLPPMSTTASLPVRKIVTPLPVTLMMRDMKTHYSAQTPYRTSAMYNVFLMKKDAEEVFAQFEKVAIEAMEHCTRDYLAMCEREGIEPVGIDDARETKRPPHFLTVPDASLAISWSRSVAATQPCARRARSGSG